MNSTTSQLSSSRELVTVAVPGLKSALRDTARARGVSVSTLVREALRREGLVPSSNEGVDFTEHHCGSRRVRVSLRFTRAEAEELASGAHAAGLALGRYIVELMATRRTLPSSTDRVASIAALAESNSELSTLSRNIAHLALLLRRGEVSAARQYRESLDCLESSVQEHLARAAEVLAGLSSR